MRRGYDAFEAVVMEFLVLWYIMPCAVCNYKGFGWIFPLESVHFRTPSP